MSDGVFCRTSGARSAPEVLQNEARRTHPLDPCFAPPGAVPAPA